MSRSKKSLPPSSGVPPEQLNIHNLLESYTEIEEEHFDPIFKEFGNNDGKLKIVDTGVMPRYFILSKLLLR